MEVLTNLQLNMEIIKACHHTGGQVSFADLLYLQNNIPC